jgi:hypothetical protein
MPPRGAVLHPAGSTLPGAPFLMASAPDNVRAHVAFIDIAKLAPSSATITMRAIMIFSVVPSRPPNDAGSCGDRAKAEIE